MGLTPDIDEQIRVAVFIDSSLKDAFRWAHQWLTQEPMDTRSFVDQIKICSMQAVWSDVEELWTITVYYKIVDMYALTNENCVNP